MRHDISKEILLEVDQIFHLMSGFAKDYQKME